MREKTEKNGERMSVNVNYVYFLTLSLFMNVKQEVFVLPHNVNLL